MKQKPMRLVTASGRQWGIGILILACLLRAHDLLAFVNGQNALYVLGQPNFTSNVMITSLDGLNNPMGVAYDVAHRRLFVADTSNNRVLVYDLSAGIASYNMPATYVLGQPDFTTNSLPAAETAHSMWGPHGIAYDPVFDRLFVVDRIRVVVFDLSGGITNNKDALFVLGLPTLTSVGPVVPTVRDGVSSPLGISLDPVNERLFVADADSNRVLVFDVRPSSITSGMDADHVLGQPDFTTGFRQPRLDRSGFSQPSAVLYETNSQRLFVADAFNNRVLVFNLSGGITDNMDAANVLGQPDFTSKRVTGSLQHYLGSPYGLAYDPFGQRLFVGITDFERVLVFDLRGGVSNLMNATSELGQPDFSRVSPGLTRNRVSGPYGVAYDTSTRMLFVADAGNSRIMVFSESDLAGTSQACSGATTKICGTVMSAEAPGTLLGGVPMELRDGQGRLLLTMKTDKDTGAFEFVNGLVPGDTYYVSPALGRTQSAAPFLVAAPNLQSVGAITNFQVRGWPGTLKISGPAGTSVLISSSSYSGLNAPNMDPTSPGGRGFYSTAIGGDGVASLQVSSGTYYLTCWVAAPSGSSVSYQRAPAFGSGSQGPTSIIPNQVTTLSCPQ